VTKLRLAQVNTTIGLIKNSIKTGAVTSMADKKKLNKIEENFMAAITKQIDA